MGRGKRQRGQRDSLLGGAGLGLVTLYRPVGQGELDLIALSRFRAFPPRLVHQPIFYPVLTEEYATRIARDWNTKDPVSGYVGYVLRFSLPQAALDRWPPQQGAAGAVFRELWVPAAELAELNALIEGPIEVVAEYRGAAALLVDEAAGEAG